MPGDTDYPRDTGRSGNGGGAGDARREGRRRRRYLEEGGGAFLEPLTPSKRAKGLGGAGGPDDNDGYYDVPMLKPPVWKWEISAYFFLGGLSAGAFLLSRMAAHAGGGADEDDTGAADLKRVGTAVAALAALPCAPLLIADLGDRERFHHMLRVWKPSSPMNLGSWVLSGYSALAFLDGLRLAAKAMPPVVASLLRRIDPLAEGASDVAGIPLALLLAGYTGVLLSGSATPVWSKNRFLGALFSASAVATGASACRVALLAPPPPPPKALPAPASSGAVAAAETPSEARERVGKTLGHIELACHIGEALALVGYLADAGRLAEPLTTGKQSHLMHAGAEGLGIVVPSLLEAIPAPPKIKRWLGVAGSVASLVGGLALRHAVVHAGHESTDNPRYNREATRKGADYPTRKGNAPPPVAEAPE